MKCPTCGKEWKGEPCTCGYVTPEVTPKKQPFILRYWWILLLVALVSYALGYTLGETTLSAQETTHTKMVWVVSFCGQFVNRPYHVAFFIAHF